MYLDEKPFNGQYLYSIKLEARVRYGRTHYRSVCCGRKVKDGKISCAVKTSLEAGTGNVLYFPTYDQAMEFADRFVDTYPTFKFDHIGKTNVNVFYTDRLISVNTTCGLAYVSLQKSTELITNFTDVVNNEDIRHDLVVDELFTMEYQYILDSGECIVDKITDTYDHLKEWIKKDFKQIFKKAVNEKLLVREMTDNFIDINFDLHFKHDTKNGLKKFPLMSMDFYINIVQEYSTLKFYAYTLDKDNDWAEDLVKLIQRSLNSVGSIELPKNYYQEDEPEYNKLDPEDYNLEDWD